MPHGTCYVTWLACFHPVFDIGSLYTHACLLALGCEANKGYLNDDGRIEGAFSKWTADSWSNCQSACLASTYSTVFSYLGDPDAKTTENCICAKNSYNGGNMVAKQVPSPTFEKVGTNQVCDGEQLAAKDAGWGASRDACVELCDGDVNCNGYAWNDDGSCITYRSCDKVTSSNFPFLFNGCPRGGLG